MSGVLKAILDRFTCRDFLPDPLSKDQVVSLVDAALASPSAMNLQPWHIIAVTDKTLIDEMDRYAMSDKTKPYHERIMERGGKMFYGAPCAIFIAINDSDHAPLDAGIVSQNVSLAAFSMGLGSCICGMMRIPLENPGFYARVGIPQGMKFGMSVLVGRVRTAKAPHELDRSKVTFLQ